MTKPAITKRAVKAAALTYAELDTNFQNLADATVTLTAGTGGTAVTADLNGTITLVAGTNVTLTGNNTTKTITINSSGGTSGITDIVQDTTPQLGGNLDTNGKTISDALGRVRVNDQLTVGPLDNAGINIGYEAGGSYRIESSDGLIIGSEMTFNGSVTGPRVNLSNGPNGGSISLGKGGAPDDKVYIDDVVNINSLTTTQRNALVNPQNGDLFYNSSTNKFQGYANGVWVDLH
jgi:hypothetical protein